MALMGNSGSMQCAGYGSVFFTAEAERRFCRKPAQRDVNSDMLNGKVIRRGTAPVGPKLHFAPKKRHFAKKAPRFLPFGI